MTIEYRTISSLDEIAQAVAIQGVIWKAGADDAVPDHTLIALQHNGGLLAGAFEESKLVGLLVGFIGYREGINLFWSHFTGVLPSHQGKGIGRELKWFLCGFARERGFNCVGWTFDPLQRNTASFNLRYLGCICNQYHTNLYGEMRDGLNSGWASDRFEIRWWINSERVQHRHAHGPSNLNLIPAHSTLLATPHGNPGDINWPTGDIQQTLVEIPEIIGKVKDTHPEIAIAWRLQTGQVFTRLFEEGFYAVDFASQEREGKTIHYYLLERDFHIR